MIPPRSVPKVLVCHSGRQHSHQLATALASQGMLARYVTGLPTEPGADGLPGRLLRAVAKPYRMPVDPALVRHVYVAPILRRAAGTVLSGGMMSAVSHRADGLFDRWVCGLARKLRPDVVVAYENSALHTFRRAKQMGITTVLDAASFHHCWQDRFLAPTEGRREHGRIVRRKEEEIRLADHILTVSTLARASYIEAGVPEEHVHAIPVGVDTIQFRPAQHDRGAGDRDFRFVYVGNDSPHKGLDVLREAVGRLRDAGERLTATLFGVSGVAKGGRPVDGCVGVGRVDHERLADELPEHHVLVLPSFFDSFGMVVAEAMAAGLPAIVTENVGAREMITPGENGRIVEPGDVVSLVESMRWFIENRERLPAMSRAARQSAERYDWKTYHRKIAEFFARL
jgi:glycosyltransferase involved in cell wall biosynthesis